MMFKNLKATLALSKLNIGERVISDLLTFKAREQKDDPARRLGIHGPYEEVVLRKTGRLPNDYFDGVSAEPWGLRSEESRSNILWQVLSGVMDAEPYFASTYMSLALDQSLSDGDYAKELCGLNKYWGDYVDKSFLHKGHKHQRIVEHGHSMSEVYGRVACPACSVLTAVALRDAGMHEIFTEMLPMKPQDRRVFLEEKGFTPLLDVMISDLQEASSPPQTLILAPK